MHTSRPTALQPVKQKVRVYNPNLLSELLLEVEKFKIQQAQVTQLICDFAVALP